MKTLAGILLAITVTMTATAQSYWDYYYKAAFTVIVQNIGSTTAATKFSIKTQDLLNYAAEAEFYGGYYSQSSFPSGTKLVYYYDNGWGFGAVDSYGNVLCDLSNIMWIELSNPVTTTSGATETDYYTETLYFDTTYVGMELNFQVSYQTTEKYTSTSDKCKGKSGAGSGSFGSRPLVITGSCSSTGY